MAFLLLNHKIKYLFYTIVVVGLILFIVFQEDILYTYVASIFSSSASADVRIFCRDAAETIIRVFRYHFV